MAAPRQKSGNAAKAMTMIKRLTILTMLRRTELDRTDQFFPSRFAIACGAAAMKARFAAHPLIPRISDVKGGGPLGSDVPLAVLVRDTKVLDCVLL